MKKFLSLSIMCLVSIFMFAGCGIKGGSLATGIEFVRDVFYVDFNVETFLDYKVYPSTSQNVFVNYTIENDLALESYFNFTKEGKIIVYNNNFTSIKVIAKLNEFTDVCEVRLKRYPTSVSFNKSEDYINAGSVYPLDLFGIFEEDEEEIVKSCKDQQFVFKLTSSDPSIVEVVSQDDLLVRSTGRSGEATVTAQICDSLGNEKGLSASVKLTVVENISSSFITLDGAAIHNKSEIEISTNSGRELELRALYFGKSNLVNEVTDFDVYLSNNDVFEIIEDDGIIYLKVKYLAVTEEDEYYTVKLTIQSSILDSSGKPHRIDVNIRVRIL